MKYILKPVFKIIACAIAFIFKVFLVLLASIIGYMVAIGLSLWNFKMEKVDMRWFLKTLWRDLKID